MDRMDELTDEEYAAILRQMLKQYEAMQFPRGSGKSMIPHILKMSALDRAIEVLEEKGEK